MPAHYTLQQGATQILIPQENDLGENLIAASNLKSTSTTKSTKQKK